MMKWYRYQERVFANFPDDFESSRWPSTVRLQLQEFEVAKVTPKGVRLENGRFVLLEARKRFACPTKEEALKSYVARKRRQQGILNSQLYQVARGIALAEKEMIKVLKS